MWTSCFLHFITNQMKAMTFKDCRNTIPQKLHNYVTVTHSQKHDSHTKLNTPASNYSFDPSIISVFIFILHENMRVDKGETRGSLYDGAVDAWSGLMSMIEVDDRCWPMLILEVDRCRWSLSMDADARSGRGAEEDIMRWKREEREPPCSSCRWSTPATNFLFPMPCLTFLREKSKVDNGCSP